jgi:hypothetical protein
MTTLSSPTCGVKVSTRTTKASTIHRSITISIDDAPWGKTVYASVFEKKQLKTKTVLTSDVYTLERQEADFGIGFVVTGVTGEPRVYNTLVGANQTYDDCDCPAGCYRGSCRHIDCCKQALKQGLI